MVRRASAIWAVLVLGTGGCFALDALSPRGLGDGIGYPILLVLCLWLPGETILLTYAGVASLLTVAAGFLSEDGISIEGTIVNRAVVLATLWVIAMLLRQRRRLEQRLEASEAEARVAAQAKTSFLANMSHELRTPLNAIIGFSDLIRMQTLGPVGQASYVEYAQTVHESGTHLLDIVNDVLDLARVEANKYRLEERPILPAEVIVDALRSVDLAVRNAGLTIATKIDPLPQLQADAQALRQMLLVILSNAIKFTPAGGHIGVTATVWAADGPDRGLWIEVTDTGIGIADEVLQRLGQPFLQAADPTTKAKGGIGLGLMLCQRLAELHGAKLDIRSRPGTGTTVTIQFPPERIVAA